METFLQVGKNEINPFTFHPIQDGILNNGEFSKPKGGLWFTKQQRENIYGNEWVEFLSWHPNILVYNNYLNMDGTMPCLFMELKKNARIFYLDSAEKLEFLKTNYGSTNLFSYEALSQDYDGIFIALAKFYNHPLFLKYFLKFAVDSLLLFNYHCIASYYPGKIIINDMNDDLEFSDYEINISDTPQPILPIPCEYRFFQEKVKEVILKYIMQNNLGHYNPAQLAKIYQELSTLITNRYAQELAQFGKLAHVDSQKLTLIDNTLTNFK